MRQVSKKYALIKVAVAIFLNKHNNFRLRRYAPALADGKIFHYCCFSCLAYSFLMFFVFLLGIIFFANIVAAIIPSPFGFVVSDEMKVLNLFKGGEIAIGEKRRQGTETAFVNIALTVLTDKDICILTS